MENISILWESREVKVKANISQAILSAVFQDIKIREIFSKVLFEEEIKLFLNQAKVMNSAETIIYRQQVLKDIFEKTDIYNFLMYFNDELRKVKRSYELLDKTNDDIIRYGVFSEFLGIYQNFISDMYKNMKDIEIRALGLNKLWEFTDKAYNSKDYKLLQQELENIKQNFKESLLSEININTVNGIYAAYRIENQAHKQNIIQKLCAFSRDMGMDIDTIVSRVGKQELFNENMLNVYADKNAEYISALKKIYDEYKSYANIQIFDIIEEIEFYFVLCKIYNYFKNMGLKLCFAQISKGKSLYIKNICDLTLFHKIEKENIVYNDCDFSENERLFIMTGVNSGGKTTYIRSLAQAMILFNLGGYICAEKAKMPVADMIYTHFPAEEGFDRKGRLEDEKARVEEMLKNAGSDSFILLNETYSSTYESLSLELSMDLINKLILKKSFAVYVTHNHKIDEKLKESEFFGEIKYLVPEIDIDGKSTYKILKSNKGEKSHADTIILKYGLTKSQLLAKLRERGELI